MLRGRPPKPECDAKAAFLQVRVNADEKRLFENAARLQFKNLSEWIRHTLFEAATKSEAHEPRVDGSQLQSLITLKDQLRIPGERWILILAKYGVARIEDLSSQKAQQLISNMERKVKA